MGNIKVRYLVVKPQKKSPDLLLAGNKGPPRAWVSDAPPC